MEAASASASSSGLDEVVASLPRLAVASGSPWNVIAGRADLGLRMSSRAPPTSVNASTDEDDARAGRDEVPPRAEARRADFPAESRICAPRRLERIAEADERQRRLGEDGAGEDEHGVGDDEVDDVRQDVAAHDVAAADAPTTRVRSTNARSAATASATG